MTTPLAWKMWAGENDRGFCNVNSLPRTVQIYGHAEPIRVDVSEDPEGQHFGWISADRDTPTMIQPTGFLFEMQFPYGSNPEEAAGRGRVVRLRIEREQR